MAVDDLTRTRLMVFCSEDDWAGDRRLDDTLLEQARADGIAGATVWRGIQGFGASGRERRSRFVHWGKGLPLVVELVDTPERVETFLSVVKRLAAGCLVTREQVHVIRPQPHRPPAHDNPER
jgi:uncharacterized protein